jgi:hypothetical protein
LETNTKQFAPALFWGIFIFVLCAMPSKNIPSFTWLEIISPDKWVHAFIFGVFTTFMLAGKDGVNLKIFSLDFYKSLIDNIKQPKNTNVSTIFFSKTNLWIAIASGLYGVLIEFYQGYFCVDRSFDWFDALADAVGSFIALWFYAKYILTKSNHSRFL